MNHRVVRTRLALALIALGSLGVAGCGGDPLAETTVPLAPGASVSPQRYLADAAAAASAVRGFTDAVAAVGPQVGRPALLANAEQIAAARDRAAAIATRLEDQRLDDARLEAQRQAGAVALGDVVTAMDLLATAAERGRPEAFENASKRYAEAVGALARVGD